MHIHIHILLWRPAARLRRSLGIGRLGIATDTFGMIETKPECDVLHKLFAIMVGALLVIEPLISRKRRQLLLFTSKARSCLINVRISPEHTYVYVSVYVCIYI